MSPDDDDLFLPSGILYDQVAHFLSVTPERLPPDGVAVGSQFRLDIFGRPFQGVFLPQVSIPDIDGKKLDVPVEIVDNCPFLKWFFVELDCGRFIKIGLRRLRLNFL